MKDILIIGNGVAGITFAKKMRRLDPDVKITILTDENYPFYIRWQLNEYVAGAKTEDELFLYKEDWYEKNRISVHYKEKVIKIEPNRKKVITDKGEYEYDRLVIASGAHSWVPPIKGADKEGVFTLRSLNDAKEMLRYIDEKRVKDAAMIGGGLLGLELGYALKQRGISEVKVIEFFPYLLPRQLDSDGAALLQKKLEEKDLNFITGAKTQEILGDSSVEGVLIEGLSPISAEMVVVSAGVRPNMDFAKASGIICDKGIKVNNRLQTNEPDIYAIGDCAEYNGRIYGIVPPAQEQAELLARIIAGDDVEYAGSVMQNTLKVVGIDLTSAGVIDPDEEGYEIVVKKNEETYKKAVFKENRLVGLILLGDNTGAAMLIKKIKMQEILSTPTKIFD